MKKILISLAILALSLASIAQGVEGFISYGLSTEYQIKEPGELWANEGTPTDSPVLLYIDVGFGFIAVQNNYEDRFVILEIDKTQEDDEKVVYEMVCVDKDKKPVTVEVYMFPEGDWIVTFKYSNIHYAYFIKKEMRGLGYPYDYFRGGGQKLNESEKSTVKGVFL